MGAKWLVMLVPTMCAGLVAEAPSEGPLVSDMCIDVVAAYDSDDDGALGSTEFSKYQLLHPMERLYSIAQFCDAFGCSSKVGPTPDDLCNYYESHGDLAGHHSSLATKVVSLRGGSSGTGSPSDPLGSIGSAFAACGSEPCKILMVPSSTIVQGPSGLTFSGRTITLVASPFHQSGETFVPEVLIMDCDQQQGFVLASGTYTLKGFTMRNCASTASGGALSVHNSDVRLADMQFIRCSAQDGGAVAAYSSFLDIRTSSFTMNLATWFGGALYTDGCGVSVEAAFDDNVAFGGDGFYCSGGDADHFVTYFNSGGVQVDCDKCSATGLTCPASTLNTLCSSDANCKTETEFCSVEGTCKSCRQCTFETAVGGFCKACNGKPAEWGVTDAPPVPVPFVYGLPIAESCSCPFILANAGKLSTICVSPLSCGSPQPACHGAAGDFLCSGSTNYKVSRVWYTYLDTSALISVLDRVKAGVAGVAGLVIHMQCPATVCDGTSCTHNRTELVRGGCKLLKKNSDTLPAETSGFVDIDFELEALSAYQSTKALLNARSYLAELVSSLPGASSYEVVDAAHTYPIDNPSSSDDSNACGTVCITLLVLGSSFLCCMLLGAVLCLRDKHKEEPVEQPRGYGSVREFTDLAPPANPLVLLDSYVLNVGQSVSAQPQPPAHVQRDSSSEHQEVEVRHVHVTESETDLQKLETEPSEISVQYMKAEGSGTADQVLDDPVQIESEAAEPEAVKLEAAELEAAGVETLETESVRSAPAEVTVEATPVGTPPAEVLSDPGVSTPPAS